MGDKKDTNNKDISETSKISEKVSGSEKTSGSEKESGFDTGSSSKKAPNSEKAANSGKKGPETRNADGKPLSEEKAGKEANIKEPNIKGQIKENNSKSKNPKKSIGKENLVALETKNNVEPIKTSADADSVAIKLTATTEATLESGLISGSESSVQPNKDMNKSSTSNKKSPDQLFAAKTLPKMHSKKPKTSWLLPVMVTALLIISLGASGWTIYQQNMFNQTFAEFKSNVETNISDQNSNLSQKTHSLTSAAATAKSSAEASMQVSNELLLNVNQLKSENKRLHESLVATQEKIKALSGRQKQDWMLAEAAYLIKNAQLKLVMQKDKLTAVQLLKSADRLILEIADTALQPLREAIAKDLSDLSLVSDIDISGIAAQLNAISQQIPHLNLLALKFEELDEANKKTVEGIEDFSLEKIYNSFLKDFITIKEHSEPVKPLMTINERRNLNANIQLALQQAQIAMFQNKSQLYRQNIESAIKWIDEYFINDENAKKLSFQLSEMKDLPVELRFSNKLNAQKSLEKIRQQQLYHWLERNLPSDSKTLSKEPIKSSNTNKSGLPADDENMPSTTLAQGL